MQTLNTTAEMIFQTRWLRTWATALFAVAAMLLSPRASEAQCGASISGRFGGESQAVALSDSSTLLVSHGTVLELLSLANPQAPVPFSPRRTLALNSPAKKISMTQNAARAFVWKENGDIDVLVVSHGAGATMARLATIGAEDVVDILADVNTLYIATTYENIWSQTPYVDSAIHVWETGGTTPVFRQSLAPLTESYGYDRLTRAGNGVIWAGFHALEASIYGVEGFNVSNLNNITRTGAALNNVSINVETYITAMQAVGNTLLVSYYNGNSNEYMRAVTVTNPAAPAWQPAVNLNGRAVCMAADSGQRLRISIRGSGVGTWNVTNPASLVWMGAYFDSFPEVMQMVASTGSNDYWAAGRAGMMTMNLTNFAAPSIRSTPIVAFPTGPMVVRQRGNISVVLDYTLNTMRIYDYSLPEFQQLRSSYFLPLYSEKIELADLAGGVTLACVSTAYDPAGDRIAIIDITNPTNPVLRSTVTGFRTQMMAVSVSRLYAFTSARQLKIIEVSSPTSPLVRSTTQFGGWPEDYTCMTAWSNNALAIGTNPFGLWTLDTTNATAPFVAGIYNPVGTGFKVKALAKGNNNFLYMSAVVEDANGVVLDRRLETMNVSNIANPTRRFVHTSGVGAGAQPYFSALTFVSNANGKFLLGTENFDNYYDCTDCGNNEVHLYHLPPGFLTGEAVPFPIQSMYMPHVIGSGGVSGDGTRVLFPARENAGLYQVAMPTQWAPGVGLQPQWQRGCINRDATFVTFASANPAAVTYQWYRGNTPLSDGPTGWGSSVFGSVTEGITISNVRPQDALYGYSCRVTNSCGSTFTWTAYMNFCAADYNCDGGSDFFDYLDFVEDFSSGAALADYNADGVIDFFDYLDFTDAFSIGC